MANGLSYKKLDLHIHTPASRCFEGKCEPKDIITTALENQLDAIAITDHNTAQWIDQVKEVAKKENIVVFPGVEISCTGGKSGIHILGIFDPDCNSKHIEALLSNLGIYSDDYGSERTITDLGPIAVIEEITKQGGLAVLAHANSSHGVLNDMKGNARTKTIQYPLLLAAEGTDFNNSSKIKKHNRVIDLLDGTDPTYQRKLAVYQSSDNLNPNGTGTHCLNGIGASYSYFKMEDINLESLGQCFVDPDTRIRQEEDMSLLEYSRISKVEINSGFLENQEITFHQGLNSILGGKGSGKSVLIELMRFVLNQEPTNPSILEDHNSKLYNQLGAFGKVEITIIDENGHETNIARTYLEIDDSPYDKTEVPFDPAQIFPVLFLSQNEIVKIAESESEQLQFIDRFFDFHTLRSNIIDIEQELEQLDLTMAEGLRAIKEFDEVEAQINNLNFQIHRHEETLKDPRFDKFQEVEAKEKAIIGQKNLLQNLLNDIRKSRNTLSKDTLLTIPKNLSKDPQLLRNQELINQTRESIEQVFEKIINDIENNIRKTDADYQKWKPKYLEIRKKYEDYIQEVGGDYKAIALSRSKLIKQGNILNNRLSALGEKKNSVKEISGKRSKLLDKLQTVYESYTDQRKAKCDRFQKDSDGKLQLKILDKLNVEQFKDSLISLKRGSYLRDEEIHLITEKINPRNFVISILRYDATMKSKFLEDISRTSEIEIERMKILADFLINAIPYETLLSLQYKAQPQDRPEILYDVGNKNYQPLSSISVGQKCTAMLVMALSDGKMPIVIDQPEDSLDIKSIWDDICTKLRRSKEIRQFIFTTHNSSLAVASDTDCYLILEGDSSHSKLIHIGSMDHDPLRTEVKAYLEGGDETYNLKKCKYRNYK